MSTPRNSRDVRNQFTAFFKERGHRIVPSSPVFPQDDKTLLFTNAGMNQFKDVFLGTGSRDYKRAADTQKCIRMSGKHNDLEEVGVDTYHHTFFEMLGNWSFGDYFKADAIVWAWELLTKVWGLPRDRLWVTVFAGDAKDGLPADEEAERLWKEGTDIDPTHVLRFGKKDNFWEMGETGPCGPCSEIHIDRGGPGSNPMDGANRAIGVNAGNERFMELWNLVFMQFNRLDDGSLRELPAKSVDTGMGFERVLSVLQGKSSNYDTDLFTPIFEVLSRLTGKRYGHDPKVDIAFRVCADHTRAVTAAISDGALPSNLFRGYALRRLIRRAARYGKQDLGMEQPFLWELVPAVADTLGDAFPEMRERTAFVAEIVKKEEESFGRTLGRGLVQFERLAERISAGGGRQLPGREAFELYATYGFPPDLVQLMARERKLELDLEGWKKAEEEHAKASKGDGGKFAQLLSGEQLDGLPGTRSTYHELGERSHTVATQALLGADRQLPDDAPGGLTLVLAESPFYAESGGQVGDCGVIEAADGSFQVAVDDTQRVGGVIVHLGRLVAGRLPDSWKGCPVTARADDQRRWLTRKNHTATHLLHKALKLVLGEHVKQQGSYVGPDRLRFDYSHPKGLGEAELEQVEALVNDRVFRNAPVTTTVEQLESAKARGVIAMFGEKYDDRVRVLDVGGWSTELCGGTHVAAAGDIGPFVVVAERAVAAGVRRIEAITGPAAVAEMQRSRRLLKESAHALKAKPEELAERIAALQQSLKDARKEQEKSAKADLGSAAAKVKAALVAQGGIATGVIDLPDCNQQALRELGGQVADLAADLAVVLVGRGDGRAPFLVLCKGQAIARGLKAGAIAQVIAGILGGGGGGRPDQAQGQGTNLEALPQALAAAQEHLAAALAK